MARKALKDELPGMQLRSAVRAVGKGLLQDQANKKLGSFGGLLGNIVASAGEPEADDRLWRALPGRVFIARATVPAGDYVLRIPGQPDAGKTLSIRGRTMVIPVRVFRDKTYFGEVARFGDVSPVATATDKAETSAAAPTLRKAVLATHPAAATSK